jgi:hypothetical protein
MAQTQVDLPQTASATGIVDVQIPDGSLHQVGQPNLEVRVKGQVLGSPLQFCVSGCGVITCECVDGKRIRIA